MKEMYNGKKERDDIKNQTGVVEVRHGVNQTDMMVKVGLRHGDSDGEKARRGERQTDMESLKH